MTQIPPGTLRAYLDEDPTLDVAARAHVEATVAADPGTAACLDTVRAEREATRCIFARFAAPAPDSVAVERAYRSARSRREAPPRRNPLAAWWQGAIAAFATPGGSRAGRLAFGGVGGVLALVLLVTFAPVGNIVSATLDQFRYQPEKFAVITLKASDMPALAAAAGAAPGGSGNVGSGPRGGSNGGGGAAMPGAPNAARTPNANAFGDLSRYAAVTSSLGQARMPGRPVLSANMAQAFTGRAPSVPTFLPPGVPGQPLYLVSDAQKVEATLDLANLRPALAESGAAITLPPGGDAATVQVTMPAATITSYGFNALTVASAGAIGAPGQRGVIVATMATPTVDVQGLDVRALAAALAGMPGVPPTLAAQLRSADLSRTLVVPVTETQTVRNGTFIGGNPSTLIAQRDGSSAVALWFKGGTLYVVAGTFDGETILKVAQSVK